MAPDSIHPLLRREMQMQMYYKTLANLPRALKVLNTGISKDLALEDQRQTPRVSSITTRCIETS